MDDFAKYIDAEIARKKGRKNLRDKFAMAALTGLLAGNEHDALCRYEKTAELAYQLADAMMEAREK